MLSHRAGERNAGVGPDRLWRRSPPALAPTPPLWPLPHPGLASAPVLSGYPPGPMKIDAFCHIIPKPYLDRFDSLLPTAQSRGIRGRSTAVPAMVDLDV